MRNNSNKHLKAWLLISSVVFAYSLIILASGILSENFAEFYSGTVSSALRIILAAISNIIPFSLAEALIIILPLAYAILLARAIITQFVLKIKGCITAYTVKSICIILIFASLFINTFGICYRRLSIEKITGLDTDNISEEDINVSATLMLTIAEVSRDKLTLINADGSAKMPYGFDDLCSKIAHGYSNFINMPPVISVKPVALSELWTYTHISGMYMPFTGESNVNMNYPDYVIAYSAAHEIAHQLGVASEDEANFFAFLSCLYSNDDYLIYSASMNMFSYLVNELYASNTVALYHKMDQRLKDELISYSNFFKKYRNSKASKVSENINNSYLKSQGVVNGTRSYSEVSKLSAAYIKSVFPDYFT